MILETERLILRPWKETDAESLYEYAKDPEVGPIAGWPPHKSVEESLSVICNVFQVDECYAICEKEEDKAIGAISLKMGDNTDMTEREDECELGYWLGKPFWGRGYMPEAAEEILRHGFEELGMTTIWCGYYDGNLKSRTVQYKLGFHYHHTCDEVEVPLMNEVRVGHTNYMTKKLWDMYQRRDSLMMEAIPDLERAEIKKEAMFLEDLGYSVSDEKYGIDYTKDDICIKVRYHNHGDPTDIYIKFSSYNRHFSLGWLMRRREEKRHIMRSSFLRIMRMLRYLRENYEQMTDCEICQRIMEEGR